MTECEMSWSHGSPFRYCPCGWIEDSLPPKHAELAKALREEGEHIANVHYHAVSFGIDDPRTVDRLSMRYDLIMQAADLLETI